MIANIGNFHTLAFRLGAGGIEGVFEHHTGLLDVAKLTGLLVSLADGTLQHAHVFEDHGHGALVYSHEPLSLGVGDYDLVVTGPRRNMLSLNGDQQTIIYPIKYLEHEPPLAALRPYFPAPFGDMMITGCFGLLAAVADIRPEFAGQIRTSLTQIQDSGIAPWDLS
jgi:hypothetical protein